MVKSALKTNLIPRFSLLLGENPGNKVAPKSCLVTKHGQAKDAAEVPAMYVVAGTACDTTQSNEDITPPATRNLAGLYCQHACKVELKSTLRAYWQLRLTPLLLVTSVLTSEGYCRQYRQLCRR